MTRDDFLMVESPLDETRLAVTASHFAEDIRTMLLMMATMPGERPAPAAVRRLAAHRVLPGCPFSYLAKRRPLP